MHDRRPALLRTIDMMYALKSKYLLLVLAVLFLATVSSFYIYKKSQQSVPAPSAEEILRAKQFAALPPPKNVDPVAWSEGKIILKTPATFDSVLVEFKKGTSEATQNEIISRYGGQVLGSLKYIPYVKSILVPESNRKGLSSDPNVTSVTSDEPVKMTQDQTLTYSSSQVRTDAARNKNITGEGIRVAVIDTGIDTSNPDFVGAIDTSCSSSYFANTTIDNQTFGHGTHIAGIIAARDDDHGIVGVAPGAKLCVIRTIDDDGLSNQYISAWGIEQAINSGAQVINYSGGFISPELIKVVKDAVNKAINAGIVFVAAAGNAGFPAVVYPAAYSLDIPGVIAVSAVDQNNVKPSNYPDGSEITLVAPGINILSDCPPSDTGCREENITEKIGIRSGSSMSAPFVSGAVALLLSQTISPAYDSNRDGRWQPSEVKKVLTDSATDLGAAGKDNEYGYGLLNINKMLELGAGIAPVYICTGVTPPPSDSTLCSGSRDNLTADTPLSFVSQCTAQNKCEYACSEGDCTPSATISALPSVIPYGETSTLTLNSKSSIKCNLAYWDSLVSAMHEDKTIAPNVTVNKPTEALTSSRSYYFSCLSNIAQSLASVNITVCKQGEIIVNNSCVVPCSIATDTNYNTAVCSGACKNSGTNYPTCTAVVATPTPTLTLSLAPIDPNNPTNAVTSKDVFAGDSLFLYWDTENVIDTNDACKLNRTFSAGVGKTGNHFYFGMYNDPVVDASGNGFSSVSSKIPKPVSLTCTGIDGTTVTKTVTFSVSPLPPFPAPQKFNIGDTIYTVSDNVRIVSITTTGSFDIGLSTDKASKGRGVSGTIKSNVRARSGEWWRIVAFSDGVTGWVTENSIDSAPSVPTVTGPMTGVTNADDTFTISATDSQSDQVRYGIDWSEPADGTADEWLPVGNAYVDSDTGVTATHRWTTAGTHTFKVLAQDAPGLNSTWKTYTITITAPVVACDAPLTQVVNVPGILCDARTGSTVTGSVIRSQTQIKSAYPACAFLASPDPTSLTADNSTYVSDTCVYTLIPVAVDGHWSDWSPASCPTTPCGLPASSQTRTCTDPAPSGGGTQCTADGSSASQACPATEVCPVPTCTAPLTKEVSVPGVLCDSNAAGAAATSGSVTRKQTQTKSAYPACAFPASPDPTSLTVDNSTYVSDTCAYPLPVVVCSVPLTQMFTVPCDPPAISGTVTRSQIKSSSSASPACTFPLGNNPPGSATSQEIVDNSTYVPGHDACVYPTVVNGHWSDWSPTSCPTTCGLSASSQTRTCTNPVPSGGGAECTADGSSGTQACPATAACIIPAPKLTIPANTTVVPTSGTVGQSVPFSSTIKNKGNAAASNVHVVFQIADSSNLNVILKRVDAGIIDSIPAGDPPVSADYTFNSPGSYSVQVCVSMGASGNPVCGDWMPITVTVAACTSPLTKDVPVACDPKAGYTVTGAVTRTLTKSAPTASPACEFPAVTDVTNPLNTYTSETCAYSPIQCPDGQAYDATLAKCVACNNGGCTGTGGTSVNPTGSLVCINGSTCTLPNTMVNGVCTAPTTCILPNTIVNGVCTAPTSGPPSTPTISALWQGSTYFGGTAPANEPAGYQLLAQSTVLVPGTNLYYVFEWTISNPSAAVWSGDPGPAQVSDWTGSDPVTGVGGWGATTHYADYGPGTYYVRAWAVIANPNYPNDRSKDIWSDAPSAPMTITLTTSSFSVSCSGAPGNPYVGEPVTWSSSVTNGSGTYIYEWTSSTDSSLYETTSPFNRVYTTSGLKQVSLTVTDDTLHKTATADCTNSVTGETGVTAKTCTAVLNANPSTVEQGLNTTLSWAVSDGAFCASSCSGSGFDTGGAISGSATPLVLPTPPTTSYTLTCTAGKYGPPPPANATVTVITPDVVITVNGQGGGTGSGSVRVDSTVPDNVTIVWTPVNDSVVSCELTNNTGSLCRVSGSSSGTAVCTVTTQTTFTITCQNEQGATVAQSVVVNAPVNYKEF